ncbi:SPFH domain-containing protein [Desulfobacterales bacterium HSG2]|nr:SPFH domain-containing protein [Desulfobacterales bacterium HSG2]
MEQNGLKLNTGRTFKHQTSSTKHQASSIKHQASSIKHQTSSIKHQAPSIKHQASSIKHQASSIKHQASSIKHQASSIKHQASSIKHQAPSTKHQASSIKHQAPSIKHQTSNIKHQTSKGGIMQNEPLVTTGKSLLTKFGVMAAAVIAVLFLFFQTVDSNQADSSVVLQSITGNLSVITDPGPYLRFFGNVHQYKKVVAVNFTGSKGIVATSVIPMIKVRFLDTSMGEAKGVARFRIPTTGDHLINIHREFGSQDALISNLLERVVVEAAKASARTMSVEEHYSGGAGQMSLDFDDQLRNGIFVIDQVIEPLPRKSRQDSEEEDTLRRRQRVLVVKKKDEKGDYVRTKNHLAEYTITVISASIEEVDYEPRVNDRLMAQKKAAADEALARQNLKKAQQEAETAKALGEKLIAEARAVSEKEKVQAEIKAEKESSVAIIDAKREVEVAVQQKLMQAEILALQRKEAEGLKVMAEARAKAAENALDPQVVFEKKLAAWKEVEVAKYQHMSKAQLVPYVQMGQGQGGTNDNAMSMLQLLGTKAAIDLGMQFQDIGKK